MADALSVVVAAKALDGLTMRMTALAHNIANVNSARFQPIRVDFEDALSRAAARGPDAVRLLGFSFTAGAPMPPGEDRRVDLLLADASATASRYVALVDMIGRRMAIQQALTGRQ